MAQRAIGMLTSVVLARGLGAADLGVLNAVQVTANNLFGLLRLGVDSAVHVLLAEESVAQDTVRRQRVVAAGAMMMFGGAAVASLGCWLFGGWLAETVFASPRLAPWLRIGALLVAGTFLTNYFTSVLSGLDAFGAYARVAVIAALVNLVAVAVGIWQAGLAGAVWATVGTTLFGGVLMMREAMRHPGVSRTPHRAAGKGAVARELVSLGAPFYLTGFVLIPVAYVLQGLLARTSGLEELGYLRVMLSLGALVSFLPAAILGATVTSLAAIRADPAEDGAAYERHAMQNLRVVWLFALVAVLALQATLQPVVRFLFGGEYLVASPAFRWGLFGAALLAVEAVIEKVFLAGRRVWTLLALLTGRGLAFLAIGFVLIPHGGLQGYLAAEVASLVLSVCCGIAIFLRRRATEEAMTDVRSLLVLLFLTAGGAFVALSPVTGPWRTPFAGATLIVACAAGWAVALQRTERVQLRRFLRATVGAMRRRTMDQRS